MRLHRMKLKNYRGVADCAVEFSIQGVTVVEGDNEVGKTCIPEAVNLIFSVLDDSGKQAVKAVRPVHLDADPEVEVEVTSGEYRFTYLKRWHRTRGKTTLEITAPQREQLTGREAHERVKAILDETLDQELWKALTIEQGAELNLPGFGGSSLGHALDQVAGGSEVDDRDDDIWERICAERLKYWTGTGRESKERKALADEVGRAQRKAEEIKSQLHTIEENAIEATRLGTEEDGLVRRLNEAQKYEQELSEQWDATEGLRIQVERLANAHTAAQAEHNRAASDHERRREMVDAVNDGREKLASLEREMEQVAPERARVTRNSEEAASALKTARKSLRDAQDKLQLANNDRDYRRNQIEEEQLLERHERVLEAKEGLKMAEAILDSSKVDGEMVDQIEQASLEATRAKAALEASAASVEATALSALSMLIDGEEVMMGADAVRRTHITGNWKLEIPDIVQVRVQAGGESQDLAVDFQTAQEEHARLCAQGGVTNLTEARQKADERREAERTRHESTNKIEENLRDLTFEGLTQKLEGLNKRVASYPADRPKDTPLPGDLNEARKIASDAENEVAERQAEVDRCEDNNEAATEASRRAEVSAAVHSENVRNARGALEESERKLEEARQEQSDLEFNEALATEQEKVQHAAAALEHANKEFQAQDPDTIKTKLENARNVKTRAEADLRNNQDRQRELKGKLEAHGEAGLHADLNDATSNYEHLLREHERTEARADAALLLYRTFEKRRQEAHQRYVAPFKEQIEKLGHIVFGSTFEIELDTELRVARRTLNGITLDVDQVSIGAQEQLGVICRLACAAIVSSDGGGAPVVIDDALGWSDPSRLQSMGAAIAAAGRDCQVIVLTCTPGRYAHVGNATVVRLPS